MTEPNDASSQPTDDECPDEVIVIDECLDDAIISILHSFFTSPVNLPVESSGAEVGTIWWEIDGRHSYPWRITGDRLGYPCGEPVLNGDLSDRIITDNGCDLND